MKNMPFCTILFICIVGIIKAENTSDTIQNDSVLKKHTESKVTPSVYYDFMEEKYYPNHFQIIIYNDSLNWLDCDTISGKIVEEYSYINDTLDGPFFQRFNDSLILTKGNYYKGMLSGKLEYFDITSQKSYHDGKKLYSDNPTYECYYVKNKKNGLFQYNIDNYNHETGLLINNKPTWFNISYDFYGDSKYIRKIEVIKDEKYSTLILFYLDGAIQMKAAIKQGSFSKLHFYDKNGILIRKEKWRNGVFKRVVFPKKFKSNTSLYYDKEFMIPCYDE